MGYKITAKDKLAAFAGLRAQADEAKGWYVVLRRRWDATLLHDQTPFLALSAEDQRKVLGCPASEAVSYALAEWGRAAERVAKACGITGARAKISIDKSTGKTEKVYVTQEVVESSAPTVSTAPRFQEILEKGTDGTTGDGGADISAD